MPDPPAPAAPDSYTLSLPDKRPPARPKFGKAYNVAHDTAADAVAPPPPGVASGNAGTSRGALGRTQIRSRLGARASSPAARHKSKEFQNLVALAASGDGTALPENGIEFVDARYRSVSRCAADTMRALLDGLRENNNLPGHHRAVHSRRGRWPAFRHADRRRRLGVQGSRRKDGCAIPPCAHATSLEILQS